MARRDRFAVKGNQKRGQNRNRGGAPAFVKPPIATKGRTSPAQIEQIKQAISQLPPEKIKRVIPQLPPEVIQEVIPQLPPEVIQEVIPQLPPEVIQEVIPQLPPEVIQEVIPQLPPEVIQEVIPQLPPEVRERVIPQLPPEVRERVINRDKGKGRRQPPVAPPPVAPPPVAPPPEEPVYVPPMTQNPSNLTREEIETGVGEQLPVAPPPPMPQFEEPVIPPPPVAPPPVAPPPVAPPPVAPPPVAPPPVAPPPMPQFEEPVYVPPMNQNPSNLTREEIETGVGEQPPVNFYTEAFTANDNQKNRPPVDGPAVDALNLRTDANEATKAATDQYEADVAAYKDTEATEAEQGIASLPEFSDAEARAMEEKFGFNPNTVSEETTAWTPHESYEPDPNAVTSWSTDVPSPTGIKAIDDYNAYLATPPTAPTAYSEEPDLSTGTDGMVNLFGDTEAYGGDVINPDPIYQPPVNDGGGPDGYIPLPSPIDDGRPRNIYTGRPIRNPYVPYEEPSKEMAEYTRPMSAERFGASPGMGPQINPPKEPIFANMGGNLDKGLSRLPLNQQNDTLTQIFQNGFRPRR